MHFSANIKSHKHRFGLGLCRVLAISNKVRKHRIIGDPTCELTLFDFNKLIIYYLLSMN